MKRLILILCGLIAFCGTGFAQREGRVDETLTLRSSILNATKRYAVYLPAGYDDSKRSYPVLYLLHGSGDNHTGWIQFGEVKRIADRAIADGDATPMIIVMPDASEQMGGLRGYFNDIGGTWRYEDFFFEELIPHIEKTLNVRAERQFRAVAGLSMGGGGSIAYAVRHPEVFAAACPLSAYPGPLTFEELVDHPRPFMQADKSLPQEQLESFYRKQNLVEYIASLDGEQLEQVRKVKWYIDCGDDDFLYKGNSLLHIAMREKQIPHEYRVRDGGHTWSYWRSALPEVLRFTSQAFHR